jgi:uncharacterized protein YcbX
VRVEQLCIYPIKSTAPHDLQQATVEPWGLAGDRRWMIVETDGTLVTARREPTLLHVRTEVLEPGRLRVSGEHAAPIEVVARPADPLATVSVWASTLLASTSPAAADAWFSRLLGRDVRLVWLDDPTRRQVNPAYAEPGDRVSFADGYPLLLTTRRSLRELDEWIVELALERGEDPAEPIPMTRFRPNVVVDGDTGFGEDAWTRVRIGAVEFRVSEPCARCVMTTIDPVTLARGREPLRTLARHRRAGNQVLFGVNLIPDGVDPADAAASIALGDALTVLA